MKINDSIIIDLPPWNKEPVEDILEDFIEESEEIFEAIDKELLELEKNPEDIDTLNLLFRNMHTLKGNSATMGLMVMNLLSHRTENILDKVRKNELKLSAEIIDVMLDSTELFREIVGQIVNDDDPNIDIAKTINKLDQISGGEKIKPATPRPAPTKKSTATPAATVPSEISLPHL